MDIGCVHDKNKPHHKEWVNVDCTKKTNNKACTYCSYTENIKNGLKKTIKKPNQPYISKMYVFITLCNLYTVFVR